MDFSSVWPAMEDCQRLGLTKSVGISNFTCKKVAEILATAKIPPAVNQVIPFSLTNTQPSTWFYKFAVVICFKCYEGGGEPTLATKEAKRILL